MNSTPLGRRWFRFSLRTLLALIVVVAIPLAWIAKERRQAAHEQQVAEQLEKLGNNFTLGGQLDSKELRESDLPQGWRRDLVRRILGNRVLGVLSHEAVLDDLAPLAEFPHLQELWLNGAKANDLAPLDQLTDLEQLVIIYTPEGAPPVSYLVPLAGLTKLKQLSLDSVEVRDIAPLVGLVNMEFLQLSHSKINDLTPLAGFKKLQHLDLFSTEVSDLSPLAGLTSLEDLDLDDTPVSDLTPLTRLPKFAYLSVKNTRVTKEQVEALQKALPNCKIDHDPFP